MLRVTIKILCLIWIPNADYLVYKNRTKIYPESDESSPYPETLFLLQKVKVSLLQAMEAHRVKAPTLLRQTANRWRQVCQAYAPAALYPQVSLFLKIPGTHFC
jgi:hypothetical protein